jgi:hypothetical protein
MCPTTTAPPPSRRRPTQSRRNLQQQRGIVPHVHASGSSSLRRLLCRPGTHGPRLLRPAHSQPRPHQPATVSSGPGAQPPAGLSPPAWSPRRGRFGADPSITPAPRYRLSRCCAAAPCIIYAMLLLLLSAAGYAACCMSAACGCCWQSELCPSL